MNTPTDSIPDASYFAFLWKKTEENYESEDSTQEFEGRLNPFE